MLIQRVIKPPAPPPVPVPEVTVEKFNELWNRVDKIVSDEDITVYNLSTVRTNYDDIGYIYNKLELSPNLTISETMKTPDTTLNLAVRDVIAGYDYTEIFDKYITEYDFSPLFTEFDYIDTITTTISTRVATPDTPAQIAMGSIFDTFGGKIINIIDTEFDITGYFNNIDTIVAGVDITEYNLSTVRDNVKTLMGEITTFDILDSVWGNIGDRNMLWPVAAGFEYLLNTVWGNIGPRGQFESGYGYGPARAFKTLDAISAEETNKTIIEMTGLSPMTSVDRSAQYAGAMTSVSTLVTTLILQREKPEVIKEQAMREGTSLLAPIEGTFSAVEEGMNTFGELLGEMMPAIVTARNIWFSFGVVSQRIDQLSNLLNLLPAVEEITLVVADVMRWRAIEYEPGVPMVDAMLGSGGDIMDLAGKRAELIDLAENRDNIVDLVGLRTDLTLDGTIEWSETKSRVHNLIEYAGITPIGSGAFELPITVVGEVWDRALDFFDDIHNRVEGVRASIMPGFGGLLFETLSYQYGGPISSEVIDAYTTGISPGIYRLSGKIKADVSGTLLVTTSGPSRYYLDGVLVLEHGTGGWSHYEPISAGLHDILIEQHPTTSFDMKLYFGAVPYPVIPSNHLWHLSISMAGVREVIPAVPEITAETIGPIMKEVLETAEYSPVNFLEGVMTTVYADRIPAGWTFGEFMSGLVTDIGDLQTKSGLLGTFLNCVKGRLNSVSLDMTDRVANLGTPLTEGTFIYKMRDKLNKVRDEMHDVHAALADTTASAGTRLTNAGSAMYDLYSDFFDFVDDFISMLTEIRSGFINVGSFGSTTRDTCYTSEFEGAFGIT